MSRLDTQDHGNEAEMGRPGGDSIHAPVRTWALLVLAITMAALTCLGIWIVIMSPEEGARAPSMLSMPDPGRLRPATLETAWPMAASRASEWAQDARLFSLSSQYDWPANATAGQEEPAGGWLIYVFVRGVGRSTESFAIMVERNAAVIARESVTVLGTDAAGFDPSQFVQAPLSSIQALDVAQSAAGASFRDECRATRFVMRQTFQPAQDGLGAGWILTYNDTRVRNGPALTIRVDASTGSTDVTPFSGSDPPLDRLGDCPR